MKTKLISIAFVSAFASTTVFANSIVGDVCTASGSDFILTVTTSEQLTSSAVINWNGTAMSGPFTLSNGNLSVSVTTSDVAPCAEEGTITVTDGGSTF